MGLKDPQAQAYIILINLVDRDIRGKNKALQRCVHGILCQMKKKENFILEP